jgi:hypothetical protein
MSPTDALGNAMAAPPPTVVKDVVHYLSARTLAFVSEKHGRGSLTSTYGHIAAVYPAQVATFLKEGCAHAWELGCLEKPLRFAPWEEYAFTEALLLGGESVFSQKQLYDRGLATETEMTKWVAHWKTVCPLGNQGPSGSTDLSKEYDTLQEFEAVWAAKEAQRIKEYCRRNPTAIKDCEGEDDAADRARKKHADKLQGQPRPANWIHGWLPIFLEQGPASEGGLNPMWQVRQHAGHQSAKGSSSAGAAKVTTVCEISFWVPPSKVR